MAKQYPYRPLRLRLYEITRRFEWDAWNLRTLADVLDVPYQTVLAWNQGRSVPKLGKILEIMKLLDVTFDELIDASLMR